MSSSNLNIRIALGADFLTSFAKLPQKQQSKVSKFLHDFQNNPTASTFNYEKIKNAADRNLRSVRIDGTYRGVVLKPESGNVYMLLWVDHHDEAYDWAMRKRFTVNSHTGGLQVIDTEAAEEAAKANEPTSEKGLFKDVKDKHLLKLGVPEELLPLVRSMDSDTDLEKDEEQLPQEAAEALYMLASGYDLEQVFNELQRNPDADVKADPDDFFAALENEDSKRRFHIVSDALELSEILSAPLEKWRVFLHPSQRRLVEMNAKGPSRVLGGAGTGKTVVAMHRARHLADVVFRAAKDRILFTTYTRNLAEDIDSNLTKICSVETKRRIEVTNLHAWVSKFLRKNGYAYNIVPSSSECWQEAQMLAPAELDLPDSFYSHEWEHVVQANGISSEQEYLRVSRVGRGQRISRQQRKQIWPVFEEYRAQLNRRNQKEFVDAVRDARILLENKTDCLGYCAVVVDEAQDMGAEEFKLIRQIIPPDQSQGNDIFIVGDAHQRIYANRVVLGHCGIDIRGRRSRKLRLNYRTTDEIRKWATSLLHNCEIDDLDGGKDDNKGYRSLMHGVKPEMKAASSFDDECTAITDHIKALVADNTDLSTLCLVARTESLVGQYESMIRSAGFDTARIDKNTKDDTGKKGIRTATMHRVKGLEFDCMIIAGVNDGTVPLASVLSELDSEHSIHEFETRERSLLYVSATRARRHVLITSSGKPSRFLE